MFLRWPIPLKRHAVFYPLSPPFLKNCLKIGKRISGNGQGPFHLRQLCLAETLPEGEGFEKIVRLLENIRRDKAVKYLNAINLGEIIYSIKREFGDFKKIEVLAGIERMDFTILPVPNSLIFQAAESKAQYGISYADCFMLASALENKAVIVTGDPEFRKVAHLADIFWV